MTETDQRVPTAEVDSDSYYEESGEWDPHRGEYMTGNESDSSDEE